MFEKAVELNPGNDEAITELGWLLQKLGVSDEEIEDFYKEMGFSFNILKNYTYDVKQYHYQQVYKILSDRRIKYVVMQYPTLSVTELKKMFNGDEDIIFVSNEENFKKALKNGKYEDYFIDNFPGYNFGHCTLKGNRLIAENVANVILKELKIN
jgi:hypothetical protein